MKLGLSALIIGASVLPVCAQKKDALVKIPEALVKKPPISGNSGVNLRTPPVPPNITNQITAAAARSNLLSGASVNILGNRITDPNFPIFLRVTPEGSVALTDAQILSQAGPLQPFVPLEEATPAQLANALYLWGTGNPEAILDPDSFLGQITKNVCEAGSSVATAPLLPFLRMINTRKFKIQSFTQLAKKYETYPDNVKLDEFGSPQKNTANVNLDAYLLSADPVEMGAFVVNPALLESDEIRQGGLLLSEEDRAAAETLMERRLARLTSLQADYLSPRDVLQLAYDYFVTQQKLSVGNLRNMNFVYRYRTDVPFEELTVAEKEAFIIRKLIRYQKDINDPEKLKAGISTGMVSIEMYMRFRADIAHLQLLDYVASKNAHGILSKGTGYSTTEELRAALDAYESLRSLSLNWSTYYEHDWLQNDVAKRAEELLDEDFAHLLEYSPKETAQKLFILLPKNLKTKYRSRIL